MRAYPATDPNSRGKPTAGWSEGQLARENRHPVGTPTHHSRDLRWRGRRLQSTAVHTAGTSVVEHSEALNDLSASSVLTGGWPPESQQLGLVRGAVERAPQGLLRCLCRVGAAGVFGDLDDSHVGVGGEGGDDAPPVHASGAQMWPRWVAGQGISSSPAALPLELVEDIAHGSLEQRRNVLELRDCVAGERPSILRRLGGLRAARRRRLAPASQSISASTWASFTPRRPPGVPDGLSGQPGSGCPR